MILDGRQRSLFVPEVNWTGLPQIPNLSGVEVVALDIETRDPNLKTHGAGWPRKDGYVIGVSLGWIDHQGLRKTIYLPIAHEGGDNLDKAQVVSWLKDWLKNFTGTLVIMNGMYDLGWLSTIDCYHNDKAQVWDVMWVAALLDENKISYKLAAIAESYGLTGKDEILLKEAAHAFGVDPKSGMWMLPARYVCDYAAQDAGVTLQIYQRQLIEVREQRLEKIVALEHSLLPCLLHMRRVGVRVDTMKAEEQRDKFLKEYQDLETQIKNEAGVAVQVFAAESVALAFDKQNIKYPKTSSGKPSFVDDWLSTHPSTLAKLITKARKKHRAAHTFCEGMILNNAVNGRVHCEFHPLKSDDGGTVSGRFSSSGPNLQQVPARDPEMNALIRGLFLPEPGELWCAADYSQQEPRLTVHYAEQRGCSKAAEAAERYRQDPNTDYHSLVAELTGLDRKKAKTINLGLAYGMGGAKLCRQLGLPTKHITSSSGRLVEIAGDEGQAILDQYNANVPFIKELSEQYSRIAEHTGEIRTLAGRVCRFNQFVPKYGSGKPVPYSCAKEIYKGELKRAFTHKALNRKIQGGSADMIKISLRNLHREGLTPLVTIHDENGLSIKDPSEAKKVIEIMRDCVKLSVPLKVDCDIGPTWGAAKPLEVDHET